VDISLLQRPLPVFPLPPLHPLLLSTAFQERFVVAGSSRTLLLLLHISFFSGVCLPAGRYKSATRSSPLIPPFPSRVLTRRSFSVPPPRCLRFSPPYPLFPLVSNLFDANGRPFLPILQPFFFFSFFSFEFCSTPSAPFLGHAVRGNPCFFFFLFVFPLRPLRISRARVIFLFPLPPISTRFAYPRN